jgi:hypothetical protein
LIKSVTLSLAAMLLAASTAAAQPQPSPDTNRDGRITLAEYQTFSWNLWLQRADRDHDGRLAKGEVRASLGARGMLLDAVWGRLDTTRDNVLSRQESDAFFAQQFQRADTNHDGVIDQAEVAAARRRR